METNTIKHLRVVPPAYPQDTYFKTLSQDELVVRANGVLPKPMQAMTSQEIAEAMTVWQYLMDVALNTLEQRKDLQFIDDLPCVPYLCEHLIPTILTRHNF